jgi:hypothetical protein
VWARNNQLTISGRTPLELSYGRRPPGLLDVETMNPEQLSIEPLEDDRLDVELKRLALKSHLEARQLNDLRLDLARNVRPSDGPYQPGDRVFYWNQDKSKIKGKGEWIRGKVLVQTGPMVTIEAMNTVMKVNQSKIRREHDEWHDVPLPPSLEQPSSSDARDEEKEALLPPPAERATWWRILGFLAEPTARVDGNRTWISDCQHCVCPTWNHGGRSVQCQFATRCENIRRTAGSVEGGAEA